MPYRNIGRAPLTSLKTEFAKIARKTIGPNTGSSGLERRPGVPSQSGLPAGSEWDYRSPQLKRSSRELPWISPGGSGP
jgi:hypothetical protein